MRDQNPEPSPGMHPECEHRHPSVHTVCLEVHLKRPWALVLTPSLVIWVLNESALRHHTGLWTLLTSVHRHIACMHPHISDSL